MIKTIEIDGKRIKLFFYFRNIPQSRVGRFKGYRAISISDCALICETESEKQEAGVGQEFEIALFTMGRWRNYPCKIGECTSPEIIDSKDQEKNKNYIYFEVLSGREEFKKNLLLI